MTGLKIGYARVSTDAQDLTAQRGLTGTNRQRPGLRQALAACRAGDTLVVTSSTASPAPCPTPAPSPTS